jgi:energy-coupling factor transport system substrate-specific component
MIAGQVAMASLPNIEPVSFLIIAGALVYGWKILFSVYVFVLVEGLIYGFGFWMINYMYVWAVLAMVAIFLRKQEGRLLWAVVSGAFGLAFGLLCAIPYIFTSGFPAAVTYYISGIPFDILHAVGNFTLAFFLLPTCVKLLRKLKGGEIR